MYYSILLIPERTLLEKIQKFRMKYIWMDHVDGIPFPHITLKRRFSLGTWWDEAALVWWFKAHPFSKDSVKLNQVGKYSDALVLIDEMDEIKKLHLNILEELQDQVITINSEWEWGVYWAHLTLFRFAKDMKWEDIIQEATSLFGIYKIEHIVLAEIGKNRDSYREIIRL